MDGGGPSRDSMREVKREFKQRRKAEKERAAAADAYWRSETGRAPRRSGRGIAVVVSLAVVAAAGGAIWFFAHQGTTTATASSTTKAATPATGSSASSGGSASGTASPSAAATPPPFDGTPARDWPVGTKGVVAPKAARVGIFSKAQVADAYAQAQAYLRTAMLDPAVVSKGELDPVFDAIGPYSTTWVKQQHAATKGGTSALPWTYLANRFRPQDWEPNPEVRVKGRMKAQAYGGRLRIDFRYVAAYWLEPRGPGIGRAVAVRRDGYMEFAGDGPRKAGPMFYGGSGWTITSGVCGSGWRYPNYLEAWVQTPKGAAPAPTATWDPTDVDSDGPSGATCFVDPSGF